MKEIILASQSPRRKELLEEVGLRFRVEPAQIEEHLDESLPITQAIEQLAKEKAMPIARRHPQCIVIGADTLVAVDGLVLGKPADEADAARMLRMLSGRRHQVIGGVAIDTVFYGEFSAQKLAGGALAFAGLVLNATASRKRKSVLKA